MVWNWTFLKGKHMPWAMPLPRFCELNVATPNQKNKTTTTNALHVIQKAKQRERKKGPKIREKIQRQRRPSGQRGESSRSEGRKINQLRREGRFDVPTPSATTAHVCCHILVGVTLVKYFSVGLECLSLCKGLSPFLLSCTYQITELQANRSWHFPIFSCTYLLPGKMPHFFNSPSTHNHSSLIYVTQ